MELDSVKTTIITNIPDGFQKEIKIEDQMLKEVKSFRYLRSVISDEEKNTNMFSKITETTAALSTLKPYTPKSNLTRTLTSWEIAAHSVDHTFFLYFDYLKFYLFPVLVLRARFCI